MPGGQRLFVGRKLTIEPALRLINLGRRHIAGKDKYPAADVGISRGIDIDSRLMMCFLYPVFN